jgi:hypothetical protein
MVPQPAPGLEAHGAKDHDGQQAPGSEQQDSDDDVVRKHGASRFARRGPAGSFRSVSGRPVGQCAWDPPFCSILVRDKRFGMPPHERGSPPEGASGTKQAWNQCGGAGHGVVLRQGRETC